jgi:hydrogenase maturation protease
MIIIDAVDFQEEPGYIGVLQNEEIKYRFNTKLSLHHAGLSDVLSIIELQDIAAPDMVLIGVQPEKVEMGLELTETVSKKMNSVIKIMLKILEEWNIKSKPASSS